MSLSDASTVVHNYLDSQNPLSFSSTLFRSQPGATYLLESLVDRHSSNFSGLEATHFKSNIMQISFVVGAALAATAVIAHPTPLVRRIAQVISDSTTAWEKACVSDASRSVGVLSNDD